jgi:hypothetical protein
MKTILAIVAYVALVWFIVKFIAFCTKDEMEDDNEKDY